MANPALSTQTIAKTDLPLFTFTWPACNIHVIFLLKTVLQKIGLGEVRGRLRGRDHTLLLPDQNQQQIFPCRYKVSVSPCVNQGWVGSSGTTFHIFIFSSDRSYMYLDKDSRDIYFQKNKKIKKG